LQVLIEQEISLEILTDYNKSYQIDDLTGPIMVRYNWIFNGVEQDFLLNKIEYLEECTGPALKLRINNYEFWAPANWFILAVDPDTYQVETIQLSSCSATNYSAFSFVAREVKARLMDVKVVDYSPEETFVYPALSKACSLIHPVGTLHTNHVDVDSETASVVIGPVDMSKHLTGKVVGDLLFW
jgi:hypothetical protein